LSDCITDRTNIEEAMDINLIRILIMLVSLAIFLGIVRWAFAPGRKRRFEYDGARVLSDEQSERTR
jgi:cbb3-type cytochrome oxidase subunit 3